MNITDDGRLAVQGGSDYFPWGEAELLRAKEEKPRKEKEQEERNLVAMNKGYQEQEEAGKVVLRHHIGV